MARGESRRARSTSPHRAGRGSGPGAPSRLVDRQRRSQEDDDVARVHVSRRRLAHARNDNRDDRDSELGLGVIDRDTRSKPARGEERRAWWQVILERRPEGRRLRVPEIAASAARRGRGSGGLVGS